MKYDEQKAFPHPVLCSYNRDYSEGLFKAEVNYALSEGSGVQIDVAFNLDQPLIKDCLVSGKAQYAIVVDSRDTYRRDVRLGSADKETFEYSQGQLRGSVDVSCFITAKEDIQSFSSPAFDEEFGNDGYQITSGDVLALDAPVSFHVGLEPFRETVSVWEVVEQSNVEMGSFEVGLEEEQIQIFVHPSQKRLLDSAMRSRDGKVLMLNGIILPALIQVLSDMSNPSYGYEDLKWYRVIKGQCAKHDIEIQQGMECLKPAQKLLELPLKSLNKTHLGGK